MPKPKNKVKPAAKKSASVGGKAPLATIGIIGGSGLYNIGGLEGAREHRVRTPFGDPSDGFIVGRLEGKTVAFLARHGRGHRFTPSEINYRANIYAMKMLGVERIVSVSAVGSLREDLHPLEFLIPDQFFDRTRLRVATFFGQGLVAHVGFDKPICPELSGVIIDAGPEAGVTMHRGGTYICMEGPQFSTLAEAHVNRQLRFDVVGMTNLTEAKLAREAELSYASVAMVTDFDCWHPDHQHVDVASVIKVIQANAGNAARLVARLLRDFPREHEACPEGSDTALTNAIITAPEARDPDLMQKLQTITRRVTSL